MKIEVLKVLPGASWGLYEASALCRLQGLSTDQMQKTLTTEQLFLIIAKLQRNEGWQEPVMSSIRRDDLITWPADCLTQDTCLDNIVAWYAALVVLLQRLAHDAVGKARIVSLNANTGLIAVPWQRESVLQQSLMFAMKLIFEPELKASELYTWLTDARQGGLSPNSLRFASAAIDKQIPLKIEQGHIRLGWGTQIERLNSSFTDHTSCVAATIARQKHVTSALLRGAGIPVPRMQVVAEWTNARDAALSIGWPVVVKPTNQEQGIGVTPGIMDEIHLQKSFETASKLSPGEVIIESHIEGEDYRLLVVNYKLMIASQRIPGSIKGDGISTVTQLVARINQNPLRGSDKRSLLMKLNLDNEALHCLHAHNLTVDSVPALNQEIRLRLTANISTGATAIDVTHRVHPDIKSLAERAARVIGLDIVGVDYLSPDITRSWRDVGGAICEVNAQPGFRPHWLGDPSRNINAEIIAELFKNKPSRIPTAAITGTNGKSTTARMLHHIWMSAGKIAGVSTTQGLLIGNEIVSLDNLSGFPGARILLADPIVEAAILEIPRKGLLVFGHPCDYYDVAALLNIQDDHIGVDGIANLDEMAVLKAEVLARARHAVVVNAEDERCLSMLSHTQARHHILVAQSPDTPALSAHVQKGGQAVFCKKHLEVFWIMLVENSVITPLMPLAEIPATMQGLLRFNESNALFAIALAWAQGIPLQLIRNAMSSFTNSPHHNPGRYNFIAGYPFKILLDFGHNPDGINELCRVINQLPVNGRRHLFSFTIGNRHRTHLEQLAPTLAKTFDQFMLGCNIEDVKRASDYAGNNPTKNMLSIYKSLLIDQGVSEQQIMQEQDEHIALTRLLSTVKPGDLLVMLCEDMALLNHLKYSWQNIYHSEVQLLNLVVEASITAFSEVEWDACTRGHPYVRHGLFRILEKHANLGANRGIVPCYLGLRDSSGCLVACMPAMQKWGNKREFGPEIHWLVKGHAKKIFEWPKFQVGVPLFAMQGPRLLVREGFPINKLQTLLVKALHTYADKSDVINIMHCSESEALLLKKQGWVLSYEPRNIWRNLGYLSFEDYLVTLRHKLRYKIRHERQLVARIGYDIQSLTIHELPHSFWADFYEGHCRVSARYGGKPWLTEAFFLALAEAMPEAIRIFAAFESGKFLAASLYLIDREVLYFDTWSAMRPVGELTFELSFYLPQIYAIQSRLCHVDFGLTAQHKTARGLSNHPVTNAHWFKTAELRNLALQTLHVKQ